MKRHLLLLMVFVFFFAVLPAQEKKVMAEDPLKNFQLIGKAAPVNEKVKTGFDAITTNVLESYLAFLSSDLLEGRETGTRGYNLASEYAASQFSAWGLKPAGDKPRNQFQMRFFGAPQPADPPKQSYFQIVPLKKIKARTSAVNVEFRNGQSIKKQEFLPEMDYTMMPGETGELKAPVVFAGYGVTAPEAGYDDYKNLDVKGKFVLIIGDEIGKTDPASPFQKNEKLKQKYGTMTMGRRMRPTAAGGEQPFNRIAHAEKMGAVGVLIVRNVLENRDQTQKAQVTPQKNLDERPVSNRDSFRMSLLSRGMGMGFSTLPSVYVSPEMADALLAPQGRNLEKLLRQIDSTVKPVSFVLSNLVFDVTMEVETELIGSMNVLGYIEGTDPKLKDEVVVIGAHLDHLGTYRDEYIFNGADDNGSGSVSVMAMARAFMLNPVKPKRSILFALWTGEEKGLLGSRYYVENPYFPLEKTVVNLNIDMLSRAPDSSYLERMARMQQLDKKTTEELMKKVRPDHFLSISYDSQAEFLLKAMKEANQYCGLDLYYSASSSAISGGGSDHASFGMKKIPWGMYLASMHEDYHRVSDSVEKINAPYMERMSRLLYLTAFFIADR